MTPDLPRELGLRDLVLFAITSIVGTRWIAAAAHAGPGSLTLWVLSAVFFMIPLAIAVGSLTVRYPGPGGMYLWTRNDFGPWHGFLCFWVFWMGVACWFPGAAIFCVSAGFYSLGPAWEGLANNRLAVVAASLAVIWIALGTNLLGLRIGKWTQNLGGASAWLLGSLLAIAGTAIWMRSGSATAIHIVPAMQWDTVSFWATIAYAMSGFELIGMMGGEMRQPERDLPRAAWIASAVTTAFYVSATLALLVVLQPGNINEVYGLAQGGQAIGRALQLPWLPPLIACLVVTSAIGQFGGLGTAVSRLPLAAGVDGLLPSAFGRIHPRWQTPHVAILTLGCVSSVLLVALQAGDTIRAGYQAIVSLMLIAGFLPFIYVFASSWKAGNRASAVSGLAVTLLAILCSVVPTAAVSNVALFEGKLALGTAAVIGSAWLVYRRNRA